MNESDNLDLEDDLREEYDLSQLKGGVRGKYAQRSPARYKSDTLSA